MLKKFVTACSGFGLFTEARITRSSSPTRLLDQVRERIRYLHYSRGTEEVYVQWCRAYIRFHGLRHPAQMGGPEVEAFLISLATQRRVSASTHSQALSVLLFLYCKVLCQDLPWLRTQLIDAG